VGKVGKVSEPAKTVPYGKDRTYNRKTGKCSEDSRLADEGVINDDGERQHNDTGVKALWIERPLKKVKPRKREVTSEVAKV
jgi:hypothetical protein